ncbi:MAG: hypothetical protein HY756_03455 [Nitrospirae bacterium]|nr:hypothetical protein [Nitrospirota bacterium]
MMLKKILLSDKPLLAMAVSVTILLIFVTALFIYTGQIEDKTQALKTQLNEMALLKDELIRIKNAVEAQEKKMGLAKTGGPVSALEQMLNDTGLKANAIKPAEKKNIEGIYEEDMELTVEKIDLNKAVNLLYKIENSQAPVKIKSISLKTTFENPNIFILHMTVSFISRA